MSATDLDTAAPAAVRPNSSHAKLLGDIATLVSKDGESVVTYVYRIDDSGRKVPSGAGPEKYLAKLEGPPDFEEIKQRWGGGFYEVMVQKRDGTMVTSARFGVDGAPKLETIETPPAVVAAESEVDRIATAVSIAMTPALEQLANAVRVIAESKSQPAPAPAVDPLALVREVMSVVRENAPAAGATDARELMKIFREGMSMGREAESPTKSVGDAIAEVAPKALEALNNIGVAMVARQPMRRAAAPMRPPGGKPGVPAASNAVVVEGSATPDQGNAVVARVRWLVDHLDMMRESGADAAKVADVVEDLLTEFEIKKLTGYVAEHDGQVGVNTSAMLAELGQVVPAPAGLVTEDGQRWLAYFLVRLAEPAEADEPDGGAPNS